MNSYTGGKNGSGVYQKIISMMPKHRVYVEGFLGSGAILRNKKPAQYNFGVEADDQVINEFWTKIAKENFFIRTTYFLDFFRWFTEQFHPQHKFENREILIYLDPPYLQSVRRSQRQIYRCDMMSDDEHRKLLETILEFDYNFMISGYDSPLYNDILASWRKESFQTTDRVGKTTEIVWLNFPEPLELHDYSFLGEDFRQRERIKRKRERWKNRLLKMNSQERFALMATIDELKMLQLGTSEPAMIE